MDIANKISIIIEMLDDSVSLEDWVIVEDARRELNFLYEEIESDFPLDDFDQD